VTTPAPERLYIMPCLCTSGINRTFTNMTQEDIIAYLIQETKIDTRNTTLNLNKLKCRSDPRPSSKAIGLICSAVLGSLLGLIVLSDIPKLVKHLKTAERVIYHNIKIANSYAMSKLRPDGRVHADCIELCDHIYQ